MATNHAAACTGASFTDAQSAGSSRHLQLHCIMPNSVQTRWQFASHPKRPCSYCHSAWRQTGNESPACRMCTCLTVLPFPSRLPVRLYAHELEGFAIHKLPRMTFSLISGGGSFHCEQLVFFLSTPCGLSSKSIWAPWSYIKFLLSHMYSHVYSLSKQNLLSLGLHIKL